MFNGIFGGAFLHASPAAFLCLHDKDNYHSMHFLPPFHRPRAHHPGLSFCLPSEKGEFGEWTATAATTTKLLEKLNIVYLAGCNIYSGTTYK